MNIYVYIDLRNNNSEAEMNIYVYIDLRNNNSEMNIYLDLRNNIFNVGYQRQR